MSDHRVERRKEARISVGAAVSVESNDGSETSQATAVDISASGVLLRFDHPVSLAAGDRVECNFLLSDEPDERLPYWGLGRIVRSDSLSVAMELEASDLPRSHAECSFADASQSDAV